MRRVREARDWAATAAKDLGFSYEECYQVKLAVSEIVANAIQHGSSRPEDPIRISVRSQNGALVVEVLDTGVFTGPEDTAGELAERGRGLELVALMMDDLELAPGKEGTLLRFTKRRELSGCGAG